VGSNSVDGREEVGAAGRHVNRRYGRLGQGALGALVVPVAFDADNPAAELQAIADERADGIAGLVPAELERGLEAVAAEGAAGRADEGTRIDEVVVHRADAVGASDLSAGPLGPLLLGCGCDPLGRRGALPLDRRWFVSERRPHNRDRTKHADART